MKKKKEVWYECRGCGYTTIVKPEKLECPRCLGTIERRSCRT